MVFCTSFPEEASPTTKEAETTKVTVSKHHIEWFFNFLMNQVTFGLGFSIKVHFFLLYNFDILLYRDPTVVSEPSWLHQN